MCQKYLDVLLSLSHAYIYKTFTLNFIFFMLTTWKETFQMCTQTFAAIVLKLQ